MKKQLKKSTMMDLLNFIYNRDELRAIAVENNIRRGRTKAETISNIVERKPHVKFILSMYTFFGSSISAKEVH